MSQVGLIRGVAYFLAFVCAVAALIGCREPVVHGEADQGAAQAAEVVQRAPSAAGSGQEEKAPQPNRSLPDPTYQGSPVGLTEEGYPFWGSPDAPVTLEEYSDYLCPFSARHFEQTMPALAEKYIATGQVKYVFRDMPLASLHPGAPKAHASAQCVAEQGAWFFWKMHDELFRTRGQWDRLPDPADYLVGVVQEIGADVDAYQACAASGLKETQVQSSIAAGQALGFSGTPSFRFIQNSSGKTYTLIGAHPVETFVQWIDALVAGQAPPQAQSAEAKPKELPFWANPKGLAPDPQRPGFTLAGDSYKGNPQARIAVVEFSNFQCPPCRQHVLEAQPVIDQALVNSGQILWVFKNLPLKSLPQSTAAAVAAECAGEQGRFWEMHHLLFEAQEQWAVDEPDAALLRLAGQLGLNGEQFKACLGSQQALERVMSDLADAQGVTNTTPTFIVLDGQRGAVFRGPRPGDQFVSLLKGFLDRLNAGEQAGSTSTGR